MSYPFLATAMTVGNISLSGTEYFIWARPHFSLGHGIFYLGGHRKPGGCSDRAGTIGQVLRSGSKNWAIGRRSRSRPRTATPSSHRGTAAPCPAAASTKTRSARPYGRYAQGWFRSNNRKSPLSSIGGVWARTGDSFTTMSRLSRLSREIRPERSKDIGI